MKIRLAIRGFAAGHALQFEERVDVEDEELENILPNLAEKHATAMAAHDLHMIEIELLDDPTEDRFIRIGTDTSLMVMPLRIL